MLTGPVLIGSSGVNFGMCTMFDNYYHLAVARRGRTGVRTGWSKSRSEMMAPMFLVGTIWF